MSKYVTYGLGKFDKSKLEINLNTIPFINKPMLAFWGSPIDAEFGWKEWRECNDYCNIDKYFAPENTIIWKLEDDCKILDINSVEDLSIFYTKGCIREQRKMSYEFDFKKILDDGYSAIELHDGYIGHRFLDNLEIMMNSWDCESIVVLDPDKIKIIE